MCGGTNKRWRSEKMVYVRRWNSKDLASALLVWSILHKLPTMDLRTTMCWDEEGLCIVNEQTKRLEVVSKGLEIQVWPHIVIYMVQYRFPSCGTLQYICPNHKKRASEKKIDREPLWLGNCHTGSSWLECLGLFDGVLNRISRAAIVNCDWKRWKGVLKRPLRTPLDHGRTLAARFRRLNTLYRTKMNVERVACL